MSGLSAVYHQIVSQLDLSSYTFSWAFPPCALSRYPSVPWPCPTLVPEPWAWPGAALERTLRIVGLAETVNGDFTILYHGPLVGRRRFCRVQRQRSTLYTVFPLHLVGFFLSFAWLCRCMCVCCSSRLCFLPLCCRSIYSILAQNWLLLFCCYPHLFEAPEKKTGLHGRGQVPPSVHEHQSRKCCQCYLCLPCVLCHTPPMLSSLSSLFSCKCSFQVGSFALLFSASFSLLIPVSLIPLCCISTGRLPPNSSRRLVSLVRHPDNIVVDISLFPSA